MKITDKMIEAVARALKQERERVRRENNAALAKDGFWPDNQKQPTDGQYARAAISALDPEIANMREALLEAVRSYAEAAMKHGWKTAIDAAVQRSLRGAWEREWFEQNPPSAIIDAALGEPNDTRA